MRGLILITEDHQELRRKLLSWLQSALPDFYFEEAGSGEQALAIVQQRPPDIVLMDLKLPGISGLEATRRIKLISPQTQVMIMSICEEPFYQQQAQEAGARCYVFKRKFNTDLLPAMMELLHNDFTKEPGGSE